MQNAQLIFTGERQEVLTCPTRFDGQGLGVPSTPSCGDTLDLGAITSTHPAAPRMKLLSRRPGRAVITWSYHGRARVHAMPADR